MSGGTERGTFMVASSRDMPRPDGRTVLVPTPDGRQLGICQWGDLDGAALFVLHGSPGSRFLRHPGSGYVDNHLKVITYDRPGYGVSTRMPGHSVADAAADIRSTGPANRFSGPGSPITTSQNGSSAGMVT